MNQDGAKIRLKSLIESDKPVVLDFIYATCTTICPVLSAGFTSIQAKLGPDTRKMQLISISIDPEHDTPKIMKEYLKPFRAKPGWDFLTGYPRGHRPGDEGVRQLHPRQDVPQAGNVHPGAEPGKMGQDQRADRFGRSHERNREGEPEVKPRRAPGGARVLLDPLAGILCLATLLSTVVSTAAGNDSPVSGLSQEETLRLGERIYRDGILPSGEPTTATVPGGISVEGSMFSCVSCHLRSGLGSLEGEILTPPTNGNVLYKPWDSMQEIAKQWSGGMGASKKRYMHYLTRGRGGDFPKRPAYTDETLADAIRGGANPDGREFNGVMPRYTFGERDMAILIAYLKSLSKYSSPGVTETTIRFATVITEEVSRKERDEMLLPLERYLRIYNNRKPNKSVIRERAGVEGEAPRIVADPALPQVSLARWELKGSPETWREQLEEYYRKEPVFALLGGITTKEWRPVHEFSEDHAIPCLFPITDLPVVPSNGWYTLYFSKGFYQEGETAARHLAGRRPRLREEPSSRSTPIRRKEKPSPPVSVMPGANPAVGLWWTGRFRPERR